MHLMFKLPTEVTQNPFLLYSDSDLLFIGDRWMQKLDVFTWCDWKKLWIWTLEKSPEKSASIYVVFNDITA